MNVHRKLAGVPVWGWMLAAAGAIALGIYFRHRATATNNASNASSGSTFGDATNSLAGGATADAPAGLDPGLADLLTNAQSALIDQGNQLNAAAGDIPAPDFGTGFDTPASTNVASSSGSGATVSNPTVTHGSLGTAVQPFSLSSFAASPLRTAGGAPTGTRITTQVDAGLAPGTFGKVIPFSPAPAPAGGGSLVVKAL
jgi:hypothetical protein